MYKKIADRTLESADTHEKNLSAAKKEGKSKKEVWERMLKENKIGALALLRNLRNFKESNVDEALVLNTLKNMRVERVLLSDLLQQQNMLHNGSNILKRLC